MNRRGMIVSSVLAAVGATVAEAVPTDAQQQWVNILTGQPVSGMGAEVRQVNMRLGNRTIECLYIFPANVPCIIAIPASQWGTWMSMVTTNINQTQISQTQLIDNSITNTSVTDNSINDSFNTTTINDASRTGSTVLVGNCPHMPGRP